MTDAWSACKKSKYVSLETFKKDGTGVRTPVWIAPDPEGPGDRLIVWTVADSWKVKRIRRNPHVRMAPCTIRGEVTGEWVDAHAEVMTTAQSLIARKALFAKYGIIGRITIFFSQLRRGSNGTVCIAVTQTDPSSAS